MSQPIERKKRFRQETELLWWRKDKRWPLRDELQFLDLERKLRLVFRRFARSDLFAQFARMRAPERFGNGHLERLRLKIFCEHVRPCHGLKHSPMPARRAQQRNNQQTMTHSFQHEMTLSKPAEPVKNCASERRNPSPCQTR